MFIPLEMGWVGGWVGGWVTYLGNEGGAFAQVHDRHSWESSFSPGGAFRVHGFKKEEELSRPIGTIGDQTQVGKRLFGGAWGRVGGWVEEEEAVGMRCCGFLVGGWVGRYGF